MLYCPLLGSQYCTEHGSHLSRMDLRKIQRNTVLTFVKSVPIENKTRMKKVTNLFNNERKYLEPLLLLLVLGLALLE